MDFCISLLLHYFILDDLNLGAEVIEGSTHHTFLDEEMAHLANDLSALDNEIHRMDTDPDLNTCHTDITSVFREAGISADDILADCPAAVAQELTIGCQEEQGLNNQNLHMRSYINL